MRPPGLIEHGMPAIVVDVELAMVTPDEDRSSSASMTFMIDDQADSLPVFCPIFQDEIPLQMVS